MGIVAHSKKVEKSELEEAWKQLWRAKGPESRRQAEARLFEVGTRLAREAENPEDQTTAISYCKAFASPTDAPRVADAVEPLLLWSPDRGVADFARQVMFPELGKLDSDLDRRAKLRQLMESEDPRVPAYIVGELKAADGARSDWIDTLLFAAEHASFTGDQREALRPEILRHALARAKRGPSDEALWAAVRQYALLLPAEPEKGQVEAFIDLLGADDIKAQQVALQSLANVFAGRPPSLALDLARTREVVSAFVRASLQRLGSPAERALAISAYHAAAAVGALDLDALTTLFIDADERGSLAWQVLFDLGPMSRQWQSSGPADDSSLAGLGSAIQALRSAVERRRPARGKGGA